MSAELPDRRPNLEHLKNVAKRLLRAYREGDPAAVARVEAALPRSRYRAMVLRLAQAQAVIAREQGFASWPRLKAYAEASPQGPKTLSVPDVRQLRSLPAREVAGVWVQLARGLEVEALVERLALGRRKGLAVREVLLEAGELAVFVDALLVGARHHNAKVRYECAHAMDMFGDQRCAGVLAELLHDPVPRVRRIAVHSISCDDCKLVPLRPLPPPPTRGKRRQDILEAIVELATNDPSIQVRRHAAGALAAFSDVRAARALETLVARETDVVLRRNALGALRRAHRAAPAGPHAGGV
ncbi:MAG: HEAT repeat domain-containing protein [Dehalococcoidia bacterium]